MSECKALISKRKEAKEKKKAAAEKAKYIKDKANCANDDDDDSDNKLNSEEGVAMATQVTEVKKCLASPTLRC
ncbi:hypothetical protein FRB94_003502 [Tulasnella sp. JGI-2019a]|nr:hypothetical protein FRB93_009199 [Tulasnella sp. JGI-2019a]KAG8985656.1 hypothetical protein FRB94_003502 [Tulasnella sp. JGI-2019a]